MTTIELDINIITDGNLLLNPERIILLREIKETGSLLMASKKIGVSYNKVWTMLEEMNHASDHKVVEKIRGGKGGGGAVLTDFGRIVLKEYNTIEQVVNQFTKKLNNDMNF